MVELGTVNIQAQLGWEALPTSSSVLSHGPLMTIKVYIISCKNVWRGKAFTKMKHWLAAISAPNTWDICQSWNSVNVLVSQTHRPSSPHFQQQSSASHIRVSQLSQCFATSLSGSEPRMYGWTANYISSILSQRPDSHMMFTLVYKLNYGTPHTIQIPMGHPIRDWQKGKLTGGGRPCCTGHRPASPHHQWCRPPSFSLSFNQLLQSEGPAVNPHPIWTATFSCR